jgi:hypothetical protein
MMIACKLTMKMVTSFWQITICLELAKVWMAFEILNDDESIPPTYQQIHCHMIFGVKMEDLHQKA